MGKTSLLHHLIGNQAKYFISRPDESSLVLAHIDLATRSNQRATILWRSIARVLSSTFEPYCWTRKLADQSKRLNKRPEAQYDEFEQTIRELRNLNKEWARAR